MSASDFAGLNLDKVTYEVGAIAVEETGPCANLAVTVGGGRESLAELVLREVLVRVPFPGLPAVQVVHAHHDADG